MNCLIGKILASSEHVNIYNLDEPSDVFFDEPTTDLITLLGWPTNDNTWDPPDESGVILDVWDNPILAQLSTKHPDRIQFVSFGPNGIDDHEVADDLVFSIEFDDYDMQWPTYPKNSIVELLTTTPAVLVLVLLVNYPIVMNLFSKGFTWRSIKDGVLYQMSNLFILSLILLIYSFIDSSTLYHHSNVIDGIEFKVNINDGALLSSYSVNRMCKNNCLRCHPLTPCDHTSSLTQDMNTQFLGVHFDLLHISFGCDILKIGKMRLPFWMLMVISSPSLLYLYHFIRKLTRKSKGICINCGYNLTGNISGTCPECGSSVLPENALTDEKL